MLTNLKPYKPYLYTPSRKPLAIHDLVITLASPRGYCAQVIDIQRFSVTVRLLDSDESLDNLLTYNQEELIQTGKQAHKLVSQYEPTPESFDDSLDLERSFPDFSNVKTTKKGGVKKTKTKKDPKQLTEAQKTQIAILLRARMKELKGDQEND